jgi:N-methylhydantoinase B/oxoprolinase/acetone carboxylase alpha subunit
VSAPAPDPVTLEVVRNALYAIAEEMSVIVMRSARSPLLKEAGDLSSALTDAQGRIIAQGRDIPMHMGVMGFTVKALLERIPAERMRDGDVWLLNLPEVGGNHLPDVKAVRPVFFEGRLVAFAVNLAHWADIGGAVPGSYVTWATESYQEGLRIAPVRIFTAAGPERETIELILSNLRGREEREGDLLAQYAADDVAARRLGRAVRALRRRDDRGLLRAPPRRVRGGDARGASGRCPTACGKERTGSTTTASTTGPSASTSASTSAGIGRRSTSAAATARSAGPSTPRTSSRARRCTTR